MGQVLPLADCRLFCIELNNSCMKSTIIALVVLGILASLVSTCNYSEGKIKANMISIPSFELIKLDSSGLLRTDSLPKSKPIIFMYFDPECHLCIEEIEDIKNNAPATSNWKILLIGQVPLKDIELFSRIHNLDDLKNITLCKDMNMSFFKVFNVKSLPSTIVYNSKGELKKVYEGPTTVKEIQNALLN
jgi:hypothetical protein